LSGANSDEAYGTPNFRGLYRVSYSGERGGGSKIVGADVALQQWRIAIWRAMSYWTMPDTADGFAYMRWPERNAKNLMPRLVRFQRIIEEESNDDVSRKNQGRRPR
jgi:hypothetical protein